MHLPSELLVLADRQLDLLSRWQLRRHGVTDAAVRWNLGRRWRLVLPKVVSLTTGPVEGRRRLVAASLYAGADAVLADTSAARWHGIGSIPDDGVLRFEVPETRASRRAGFVVVRRTWRLDPHPWDRGLVRIASPARAVVGAAREQASPATTKAVVIEAVQRRIVRLEDIRHEVEAGPVRGSRLVRDAVRAAETGAWSGQEHALLAACSRSPLLPRIWPNPLLVGPSGERLPSPDGVVEGVPLAYQLHSREYHSRDDDWEATVAGDTRLGELGMVVLGITPRSVDRDVGAVVARLERAYRSVVASGHTAQVVVTPRFPGVVA